MNHAASNLPQITITQDQALDINVHKSEARALLLLLGTCLANETVLSQWDPDSEEREGILGLVSLVSKNLERSIEPINHPPLQTVNPPTREEKPAA
jgi:hypothetical protein